MDELQRAIKTIEALAPQLSDPVELAEFHAIAESLSQVAVHLTH